MEKLFTKLGKITCELCMPLRVGVTGLSHSTFLQLTKTSLNVNLVNIINSARVIN